MSTFIYGNELLPGDLCYLGSALVAVFVVAVIIREQRIKRTKVTRLLVTSQYDMCPFELSVYSDTRIRLLGRVPC